MDVLVEQLEVPLLLLWGEQDPWIVSRLGDKLQACAERRAQPKRVRPKLMVFMRRAWEEWREEHARRAKKAPNARGKLPKN